MSLVTSAATGENAFKQAVIGNLCHRALAQLRHVGAKKSFPATQRPLNSRKPSWHAASLMNENSKRAVYSRD
jgi:hypothetical protein